MKKGFTTGQVAKICKVAPRTVSKWFDSGRLRGYRIPGSQDRPIPREHLVRFLKAHGMPFGELEDETTGKVLLVANDPEIMRSVTQVLQADRSFRVETATSGFEAGIQAESFNPDCIVVDFGIGANDARQICQNLRRNSAHEETILIALLQDTDTIQSGDGFDPRLINETFRKPFASELLSDRIRTLIGRKKELV